MAVYDIAAYSVLIDDVTAIAARAAAAIRQLGVTSPRRKADGSRVPAADEPAEAVIWQGLEDLAPAIPIVSEERSEQSRPHGPPLEDETYFLVDPLDGTREFIAGRDEFAVNIALISAGAPILGVIAAPAVDVSWRGGVGRGAARVSLIRTGQPVATPTPPPPTNPFLFPSPP